MNTLLSTIEEALAVRGYASATPRGLFAPIDYTLSLGGKRVRPLLCLMSAQLYADDLGDALPIAVALEIFHNFTLLHDDLMDKSPQRRGRASVYCHWSENTAILSGDAMSIEAYRALEGIRSVETLHRALPIFNKMAVEVCSGQQYDMEFEGRSDVRPEEYLEMIRLKTAVLLGASLRLGALSAGASDEDCDTLDQIGQLLGLAFQIQDDYLDVYGDEQTFGKPIGQDIINAKKTLMLLHTRAQLSEKGRAELGELMALPPGKSEKRIAGVRALYDSVGTAEYVRGEIVRLTNEAYALLSKLAVPSERLIGLRALFDQLMNRNS